MIKRHIINITNDNRNVVMKVLTAITIILSISMVIAGFRGMNTGCRYLGFYGEEKNAVNCAAEFVNLFQGVI